jgi:Tol biopolymer transport system component
MDLAPGTRIGPYEIVSVIGAGGMGEVYRARDTNLGREVAIKILPAHFTVDPDRRARFAREARLLATVSHPHIAAIYGFEETNDVTALVLELVEGPSLAERLERGPLSVSEALTIARQLAEALEAAHEKGIVHRDLKPANIVLQGKSPLVQGPVRAKVLDFGIAKTISLSGDADVTQSTSVALDATAEGRILGTPAYMSPEQARGHAVDKRTDIWSFGCVLFEMLSGRRLFAGDTATDTLARILEREPEWAVLPRETPASIRTLLQRCLRKDPEKRLHDIADARIELDESALAYSTSTGNTNAAQAQPRTSFVVTQLARHKLRLTVIACLLALLAGAAWWAVRQRSARDEMVRSGVTQRNQQKLTFAPGLQTDVTWSPDGRFIAYASDQAGNFDIWVQPIPSSGGDAVQVTRSAAHERQPAWSPDNTSIVYRSERDGGGLYIIPAFGGAERQLAAFGVRPRWTPDGANVLFASTDLIAGLVPKLYRVGLDGRPPQQILQTFTERLFSIQSWAAHPDGQRLSVIGTASTGEQGLFTVPMTGGPAVLSKDRMDLRPQHSGGPAWFGWSPAGTALFIESVEQWKTDLWRVDVNPQTLELMTGERLTTGAGVHTGPAITADGERLAFTSQIQTVRLWSLPLAAGADRLSGDGKPITEAGARALTFDLSRDGKRLVYALAREGVDREELWVADLATGEKKLLGVDQVQGWAQWSPDGTRVAYPVFRWTNKTQTQGETAVMVRAVDGAGEQAVTAFAPFQGSGGWARSRSKYMCPWDWSRDGQELVVGSDQFTPYQSLYLLPLRAAPHAETAAKLLTSDAKHNLWQPNVSPNGRWIAFTAQNLEQSGTATIAVMPSTGAASSEWTHVTDAREWADKPRWSPDGKLLYFIRRQTSFFNVWAVRFDPETGKATGGAFQVTHFDNPGFQFSTSLAYSELAVSSTRLILPIMETTGNIWILDNVDR